MPSLLENELCRFLPAGVTREEGNRTVRKMYIPYGYGSGLTYTKACLVGWTELDSGTGNLMRRLPWKDPDQETQYCVELAHQGIGYGKSRANAVTPTVPFKTGVVVQKWLLTAQFATLPYPLGAVDLVIGDEIRGKIPSSETTRYAIKQVRLGRDYINPPKGNFYFQGDPGAIPIPIPTILPFQEIQATWFQLPMAAYPVQAVENCLGRVNKTAMTLPANPDGKTSYAAETLHLMGVAIEQTYSPFGLYTTNVHYDLRYRGGPNNISWNTFPKPNGSMGRIVRDSSTGTKGLFDVADFNKLFLTNPQFTPDT
jgi:hypothetical protein